MIDKEKCKKRTRPRYPVIISYRITKDMSAWLHKEELSPRGLMFEAAKELGYKGK